MLCLHFCHLFIPHEGKQVSSFFATIYYRLNLSSSCFVQSDHILIKEIYILGSVHVLMLPAAGDVEFGF